MIIKVKVVPNARKNEVIEEGNVYRIRLAAPAVGGRANSALLEVLSGHFSVKKGSARILSGLKSREKVVEIRLKA